MKKTAHKKQQHQPNTAGALAAKPPVQVVSMDINTALAYFDFSQSPPVPHATTAALDAAFIQSIGDTIFDGIRQAFQRNDIPTFVKCYQVLHFCFGVNMESHRMNFLGGNSKVVMLMTAYQAAATFDRVDLVSALFDACIASPDHPMRAQMCGPIPMIIDALSTHAKPGSQKQAIWLVAIDQMIKGFVDRLEAIDPPQLCPTTGMLFQMMQDMEPGEKQNAFQRICTAMANRHSELIAQGVNSPQSSPSDSGRL
ncbi:MAG: hypothetical protein JSS31_10140 [Proteobacteria bacterium]|nr:hypothetical protein [Pseudomonadota bacterium]